jgi:epoxide hydrolase-like predicted phosphatase
MAVYEALIFDLGKVVFDLSFDKIFQCWAAASGQQAEAIKSGFQFDELFDMFERGEATNEEFRAEISQRLNLMLTDEVFDEGWCALYLDTYEGIDKLLSSLKKQYQLVALTNTNSIHEQVWKIKYRKSLSYFDKVFCSHDLKARKPEIQAYQSVLDYLGVEPQRTIFLDDSSANTVGAAHLGIKPILVKSQQQMRTDLRKILYPHWREFQHNS